LLKKKSRPYYTGWGNGDTARLLSQVSFVAVRDEDQFERIATRMRDVVAWIEELQPPRYPGALDAAEIEAGEAVYAENCSSCHGTYGDDPTYPYLFIDVDKVGTDPVYAASFLDEPGFIDWLRASWLAEDGTTTFDPQRAYNAPPSSGVWATAPYLHNGSVPDLPTLLDSSLRPAAWTRGEVGEYDLSAPGMVWEAAETGTGDPAVYDTTVRSFGNGGHTYADALSTSARDALITYLKTL
jgi:mono/diheme cytochrome c family protein